MTLECGIVGLPNVGKSTLFNAMTRSSVAAMENYPFCTIEPNTAISHVPDLRLQQLAQIAQPQKIIPASIKFVDIAGLVKGASHGEGLGNQFLRNIRETDAILHVVRCFEDENIIHVNQKVSPLDDIEIIDTELALADLSTIEKLITKIKKNSLTEKDKKNLIFLHEVAQKLNEGIAIRNQNIECEHLDFLQAYQLLTQKPVLYCANLNENNSLQQTSNLEKVKQLAKSQATQLITLSASLELELSSLEIEEAIAFLKEIGMQEPALYQLIRAAFSVLGLQCYFTVGEKEVRSWVVPKECPANKAAGVIHSDFEKHFIRAEVVSFDDFVQSNGWAPARTLGKARVEGKDYLVQDGDIILFRTSA